MSEERDKKFPLTLFYLEAVIQRSSLKKLNLKKLNTHENTCVRVCNFIKKEALAQVFSCECCEVFKNTFFIEHLWWLLLSMLLSICRGVFRILFGAFCEKSKRLLAKKLHFRCLTEFSIRLWNVSHRLGLLYHILLNVITFQLL